MGLRRSSAVALLVKSKCRNGDLGLKLTFGKVFFNSELVEPRGVARDRLLGPIPAAAAPKIGCCWRRPWVALNSLGFGEIPGVL